MRFHVAGQTYRMRITAGPLAYEGTPSLAATLQSDREILIAADCPPRDRAKALLHELFRAWCFETGFPRDDTGWLAAGASMALAAMNDLAIQGGEMALVALEAGESPESAAARSGVSGNRNCPECNTTIASGSVAVRPASLPGVAELRAYCEFCGKTCVWHEGITAKGYPSGRVVGEPRFERGDRTGLPTSEYDRIVES